MSEREIQKRLRKSIYFIVCIGILMVSGCGIFAFFLSNTLEEAVTSNMRDETDEYKKRLHKQLDTDLQLLNSVAEILGHTDLTESEAFPELLDQVNQSNDFLTMSYINADGIGIVATLGKEIETGVRLEDLQEEPREIAQKALNEEECISHMFKGDFSQERVFTYGVPVYRNGVADGALLASTHVEIFSDILSGNQVMGGTGRIHMVSSTGKFLIFTNPVVENRPDTLFGEPYLSGESLKQIPEKMERGEEGFFSFRYHGREYRAFLTPVGVNQWYLVCVNSIEESSRMVLRVVEGAGVLAAAMLILFVFVLIYGYRLAKSGNRNLMKMAYHDALTGALNFSGFQKEAKDRMDENSSCSIVTLNIHQFKFFNEIFGKDRADRLLKAVGEQAEKELGERELLCRASADQFYLLLNDTDRTVLSERLNRLMERITCSFGEQGDYQVLLYCGIVISDVNDTVYSLDQMLTHVMFALAKARETHQNTIWFFDSELHKKEVMDSYVEGHMNQALQEKEFRLYLQPKVDLKTDALGGAEALVRWQRHDGTMIFPSQFIPLFEENGFCAKLDMYMVEQVCACLRQWMDAGLTPVPVSVNQSKLTFFMPDYVNRLMELADRYQIPSGLLTLEILEGMALENVDALNRRLEILREKGFHISMDDFGSGYSSLNTLGKLKLDELKLDRGFLLEVSKGDNNSRLIMEQVVALAKGLSMSTVVEGVETEEHVRLIKELGCDYGQGYVYSRPVPESEFTESWMKKAGINQKTEKN